MCAEESAGEFVTRGACKVEEACQSVRWSITPPGTTAIARLILYQIGFNWILKCFCVCVRLNFWESPSRVANFDSLLHPWQGEWVFPWHWQEQPEKKETCETLLNDRLADTADTALSGSHCFFSSNYCIIILKLCHFDKLLPCTFEDNIVDWFWIVQLLHLFATPREM